MIVPWGVWAPDLQRLDNVGTDVVENAIPVDGEKTPLWGPVRSLSSISDALTARCQGAFMGKDSAGTVYNFAGDATKLYTLTADKWSDISGTTYSIAAGERWSFMKWNNTVVASNISDNPQTITFGGGSFGDLTTDLKFRHMTQSKGFMVAANTFDGSDGNVPNRVRWSAYLDNTSWTVDPVTMSDYQDLAGNGGWVQGVVGGDFVTVIQETSIWRMSFAGPPVVFRFDEVLPGIGALCPYSICQAGILTFMVSQDGFFMLENGMMNSGSWIGKGKVDKTFLNELDPTALDRVTSTVDPLEKKVYFSYPGSGSADGVPNKMMIYDWVNQRWGNADFGVEAFFKGATPGASLDELDDLLLGADIVDNGDFASGAGWTAGTNWAIAAGKATHTAGAQGTLSRTEAELTEGTWYQVTVDIDTMTAGTLTPTLGGNGANHQRGDAAVTVANGGYAFVAAGAGQKLTIQCGATTTLAFVASSTCDAVIDNVIVEPITDLDSIEGSLDGRQFSGGGVQLAAINTAKEMALFTGPARDATFETKEFSLQSEMESSLNSFRPLIDIGEEGNVVLTAKTASRAKQSENYTFGNSIAINDSGEFPCRERGRYFKLRVSCTGDWAHAIGVEIDKAQARPAGRRT